MDKGLSRASLVNALFLKHSLPLSPIRPCPFLKAFLSTEGN